MSYLISTYSNENDLVLDNCMGSGSTIACCKKMNRRFIGIEKEEKFFNITLQRLSEIVVLDNNENKTENVATNTKENTL